MSYVIGWKTNESIFISCDTALTSIGTDQKLDFELSSFGEAHLIDGNVKVTEGMLKLFQISNNLLIGFAGDNNVAFDTINTLKILFEMKECSIDDLIEVIKKATDSCVPDDNENDIALIIGYCSKATLALLSYNYDGKHEIIQHEGLVQIGSISKDYRELTEIFVNTFVQHPLPDDEQLITINSIVQSYGIHDYLIEQGVGGIITGAMVNKFGIQWQKDTSHLIYNSIKFSPEIINILVRDGALVAQDGKGKKRIYGNIVNMPDFNLWYEKNLKNNPDIFNNTKPKYFVFYMIDSWNITILCSADKTESSKYLKINNWGGGETDISISQELMTKLLRKKEKSKEIYKSLVINRILDEDE